MLNTIPLSLRLSRINCDILAQDQYIKGTVRPDWICMRVVSLESPLKGHEPLYVLNFLFLILNIWKDFKVLSRFMQKWIQPPACSDHGLHRILSSYWLAHFYLMKKSATRPIQWYYSHADQIWPDGTFKPSLSQLMDRILEKTIFSKYKGVIYDSKKNWGPRFKLFLFPVVLRLRGIILSPPMMGQSKIVSYKNFILSIASNETV